MLSKSEYIQYNRHLILEEIGEEGQYKLKQSNVLVIGAGGLGCIILQYLTASGVGTIGVIDHDIVDQTNLQRQILYTHDDIGKFKVIAAKERLSKNNPYIIFKTYQEKLSKHNALSLFAEYDIIVDGSDNFATRYLVNDAAIISGKPVVFGAIFKFEGQVSVFNYKQGPTYRCLYPIPPPPNTVPSCSEIGVLGVLPGIVGSFQANEVIKMICNIGAVLSGELLTYNALHGTMQKVYLSRSKHIKITKLLDDYDVFCGIKPSSVSIEDIQENKDDYFLIDVRESWERDLYNIGGIHIPMSQLPEQIDALQTLKTIVVYCESGARSFTAKTFLEQQGIKNEILSISLK